MRISVSKEKIGCPRSLWLRWHTIFELCDRVVAWFYRHPPQGGEPLARVIAWFYLSLSPGWGTTSSGGNMILSVTIPRVGNHQLGWSYDFTLHYPRGEEPQARVVTWFYLSPSPGWGTTSSGGSMILSVTIPRVGNHKLGWQHQPDPEEYHRHHHSSERRHVYQGQWPQYNKN